MSSDGQKEPLSVRDLMGPADSPPHAPRQVEPSLSDAERRIEVEGVGWAVEEGGRTRSGFSSDSGAPLLRVLFRKQSGGEGTGAEGDGDPDGEEPSPDREVMAVAQSLPQLSDVELVELLGRSRPWRSRDDVARGAGPAPGAGEGRDRGRGGCSRSR